MAESFKINPTYYYTVEKALYDAGGLDLAIRFTGTLSEIPTMITEITVKDDRPEETVRRIQSALLPFLSSPAEED